MSHKRVVIAKTKEPQCGSRTEGDRPEGFIGLTGLAAGNGEALRLGVVPSPCIRVVENVLRICEEVRRRRVKEDA